MKQYVKVLAFLFFAALFAAGCENKTGTEKAPADNKTKGTHANKTKEPPSLALTGVYTASAKQKISVEGYQNDVDKAYLLNKATGKTFRKRQDNF